MKRMKRLLKSLLSCASKFKSVKFSESSKLFKLSRQRKLVAVSTIQQIL